MSHPDQALLLAIHPDIRCGEDLAFDPLFDAIREARRADDPSLAQGDWQVTLKVADWRQVAQRCRQTIAARSKDIQLFAWLAEAETALNGLAGARSQLQLFFEALKQYWPDLHPRLADDVEDRIARLESFDQLLAQALRQICVADHGEQRLTLARWQQQSQLEALLARHPDQRSELVDGTYISQDEWQRAIQSRGVGAYQQALAELSQLQECLHGIDALLAEQLSTQAPRFAELHVAVADWRNFAERALRQLGATPEAGVSEAASTAATSAVVTVTTPAGALHHRQQAIAQLRQIAEFFRQSEPHSPVGYLAARAADWGEMSLERWLHSVIKDEAQLNGLRELLGVQSAN